MGPLSYLLVAGGVDVKWWSSSTVMEMFFFVWFGYVYSRWCQLYGKCGFCSLMIDEGVCDMLDVLHSLQECDGNNVPSLLTQLVEGSFVTDLESVEGIFQVAVEFFFVVFVGDDVRLFFGGG